MYQLTRLVTIQTSQSSRLQTLIGGSKVRKPGRYKHIKDGGRNLVKTNETIHASVHVFLNKRIVDGCDALKGLTRNENGEYHQASPQIFEMSHLSFAEEQQYTFEREILATWTLRTLLHYTLIRISDSGVKQNRHSGGTTTELDVGAIPIHYILHDPQSWTLETVNSPEIVSSVEFKVNGTVSFHPGSSRITQPTETTRGDLVHVFERTKSLSLSAGIGPWRLQKTVAFRPRLHLKGTIGVILADGEDPFLAKFPSLGKHLGGSVQV